VIDDETGALKRRSVGLSVAARPAAICAGAGHIVVYANPSFIESFGPVAVGLPAREGILGLAGPAFDLLDTVYRDARPLGRWVEREGVAWRMTAIPRRDIETGNIEGVAFNLRERSDIPRPAADRTAR
jgi:hypothetical protein